VAEWGPSGRPVIILTDPAFPTPAPPVTSHIIVGHSTPYSRGSGPTIRKAGGGEGGPGGDAGGAAGVRDPDAGQVPGDHGAGGRADPGAGRVGRVLALAPSTGRRRALAAGQRHRVRHGGMAGPGPGPDPGERDRAAVGPEQAAAIVSGPAAGPPRSRWPSAARPKPTISSGSRRSGRPSARTARSGSTPTAAGTRGRRRGCCGGWRRSVSSTPSSLAPPWTNWPNCAGTRHPGRRRRVHPAGPRIPAAVGVDPDLAVRAEGRPDRLDPLDIVGFGLAALATLTLAVRQPDRPRSAAACSGPTAGTVAFTGIRSRTGAGHPTVADSMALASQRALSFGPYSAKGENSPHPAGPWISAPSRTVIPRNLTGIGIANARSPASIPPGPLHPARFPDRGPEPLL